MLLAVNDTAPTRRSVLAGGLAVATAGCATARGLEATDRELWTFDRFELVGGHKTTAEGAPD